MNSMELIELLQHIVRLWLAALVATWIIYGHYDFQLRLYRRVSLELANIVLIAGAFLYGLPHWLIQPVYQRPHENILISIRIRSHG